MLHLNTYDAFHLGLTSSLEFLHWKDLLEMPLKLIRMLYYTPPSCGTVLHPGTSDSALQLGLKYDFT